MLLIKKILLLAVFSIFTNNNLFAINIDSLLALKVKKERPYLIINLTSTDCVMCRSSAIGLLEKMRKSVSNEKIVLLSDDKDMSLYYKKYPGIFSGYQMVYNKALSMALADGPYSTICFIANDSIHKYHVDLETKDSIIQNIINTLNKNTATTIDDNKDGNYVFVDSIFRAWGNIFEFDKNYSILHNERFEIGLIYCFNTHTVEYKEDEINDTTATFLYGKLKKSIPHKLSDIKTSKKILMSSGVPQVVIKSIDMHNGNSILFQLNSVYQTPSNDDSNLNFSVTGRYFLAYGNEKESDLFNINSYKSFLLIDTFSYENDIMHPDQYGFEWYNNHIYIMCYKADSLLRQTNPAKIKLVDFIVKGNKIFPNKIYDLKTKGEHRYDLSFSINAQGDPIVINNKKKIVSLLENNKEINFNGLPNNKDTLAYIYDISEANDTLKYVGILSNKMLVIGVYNFKNKKILTRNIGYRDEYSDAKVNNNIVLAYKKDDDVNKIFLDKYTFPE